MDGSIFAPISSRQSVNLLGFMRQTQSGHGRIMGMLRKPFLLAYKPYYKIWSADAGKDIHRPPFDAVMAVFGKETVLEYYGGELPRFNYEWYARAVPIIVMHNLHILAVNKLSTRPRKKLSRKMTEATIRATMLDEDSPIVDIFSGEDIYVGY